MVEARGIERFRSPEIVLSGRLARVVDGLMLGMYRKTFPDIEIPEIRESPTIALRTSRPDKRSDQNVFAEVATSVVAIYAKLVESGTKPDSIAMGEILNGVVPEAMDDFWHNMYHTLIAGLEQKGGDGDIVSLLYRSLISGDTAQISALYERGRELGSDVLGEKPPFEQLVSQRFSLPYITHPAVEAE